ncbi:glycosyltransferase involved in cell wall biosynthesis [Sphingobium sp. OAS761]|uniref:glycosyltransferase n=1 Tax=Sphingobium sp. OAS761 TaxID=2817901 RepID=UPI0020A086C2|nr:glycosyltransferase [Sphingobium sp. OAS761]MCP1470747.1 glycosyltransferase involved in cell wall biosynthesis [Sphingobium sp. OAS761]
MRVLTFLHSFGPGGVERVALRLIARWREQGIDAPLLMGRAAGPLAADLPEGFVYDVPHQPPWGTAWWETLWMVMRLPREIRRTRPDLLFCAGNTYVVVAVAMKLLLGRACPPVVAKISNDLRRADLPWPARVAYHLWLRVQAPFLDHVVVMTRAAADDVAAFMGRGGMDIRVVANPVLPDALIDMIGKTGSTARRDGGGRHFLFVGRMERQKNLPLLLRAFAAGSAPADRLTLVGDGRHRAGAERLAARLGIADRIAFSGHVTDPIAHMARHDALLLSSDYEGLPGVVIEAIASGLPVIATDCTGCMAELLGHGRFGMLVPRRNVAAMAAAIAGHRRRAADADAIREHVSAHSFARAAADYARLFRRVADGRRPAAAAGPSARSATRCS